MKKHFRNTFYGLIAAIVATAAYTGSFAQNDRDLVRSWVHLRVNKHCAVSGDMLRIQSEIELSTGVKARSVLYTVRRVGAFHRASRKIHFRDFAGEGSALPSVVFDGLPSISSSSGPMVFNVEADGNGGYYFDFRARRVGAYILQVQWTDFKTGKLLNSNPVLLVVMPQTDAEGNPIVNSKNLSEMSIESQDDLEFLMESDHKDFSKNDCFAVITCGCSK